MPGPLEVPFEGRLSDGRAFAGTLVLPARGPNGRFSASTADGFTCFGTWEARSTAADITVPLSCSGDIIGEAVASRADDGLSGTVTARLSNGLAATATFGNIAFEPEPNPGDEDN